MFTRDTEIRMLPCLTCRRSSRRVINKRGGPDVGYHAAEKGLEDPEQALHILHDHGLADHTAIEQHRRFRNDLLPLT
jgi:hypothetical protein